jgi:hypothetical protein
MLDQVASPRSLSSAVELQVNAALLKQRSHGAQRTFADAFHINLSTRDGLAVAHLVFEARQFEQVAHKTNKAVALSTMVPANFGAIFGFCQAPSRSVSALPFDGAQRRAQFM